MQSEKDLILDQTLCCPISVGEYAIDLSTEVNLFIVSSLL
jgi:hypothetical protein